MAITRIKNNQITDQTITNVKIASGTLTGDLMNPQLTFNSNLVLNGNLTVTGNVTAVQSQTTQITDPLITLAQGNPGISYDLGSVLIRGSGGNRFMGWKESASAFVFINTTEDGTTTGNIATTAYSNVIFGNATTIGSSTFGGITLSGNTVASSGGLILNSGSGTTTLSNAVVMNSTLAVTSSLTVQGTATVNALVSNGAIQGTTVSASANATVNALTVNNSATVGSTLSAASIQNTPIGTTTPSTGNFTTLGSTGTATFASVVSNGAIQGTTLNGSGTATVNALVSNGAIQGTTIGGSGTATFASVVSNGAIQGTALNASGNLTASALTVNNSATVGTTLSAAGGIQNTVIGNVTPAAGYHTTLQSSGTATFASVVSNGAIQGTTIGGSGNATVSALTVNNSATIGTSLGVVGNITAGNANITGTTTVNQITITGGIQNTPIGNATPSTGNFTTLGSTGTATFASVVSNGSIQGTTLNGSGTATVNALVSNGAIQGTTIGGSGTATFASVVSNGAIQGTTVGASSNATVAALTVNGSATVGTTLSATGGIQNTPIGNGTASSGAFTTLNTTGAITGATTIVTTGAATHSALTINGAAQVGTTLGVNGTATVNALTSNTSITAVSGQITGNLVVGNLNVQGNLSYINSQTLIVQDPIVELNTGPNGAPLSSNPGYDSGVRPHYYDTADRSAFFGRTNDTGYFEYYSNVTSETGNVITGTYGTIKTGNLQLTGLASVGTTLAVASNATVNALTVNNSATVGTTLSATGGIQNTPIGNSAPNAGYFTTLQSSGNTTVSALTVNNSATVGSTLGVTGNIAAGNVNATAGTLRAAKGYFTGNVDILGNLNATVGLVYANSGIILGDAITGNNALYVGVPGYTYLGSNIVTQLTGNVNSYSQINFQNIKSGAQSSTDLVLTADNGTDSTNYMNMGIAGGSWDGTQPNSLGNALKPNDGYIYNSNGNIVVAAPSALNHVSIAVGGFGNTYLAARFHDARTESTDYDSGTLTIYGGLGVAGKINSNSSMNLAGSATVNALVSNGAIQGTTINGSSTGTFASVVSNGAIQGTAITGSGVGTFASLVSNGAIQGTTINGSGNVTASALTVNGSATVGTTLSATGGIQNTPIGNGTASSGAFTTLNATGAITGATTLTITGATQENTLTVNTKANIGTDLTVLGNIYIGSGANTTSFLNPIFIGIDSGTTYTQAAIVNNQGTGSADFITYSNNGNDTQGWMDMGFTGNTFSDANYTITGKNDGYLFANGVTGNSSLGGNLVIATGSGGSTNDIIFATGGFWSNKEVMRFSNSAAAFQVKTSTAATGTTSGALQVTGGASVGGNFYVAGAGTWGNITHSNVTISSNLTNTGITINPNGTGTTTFNSGLNSSKTVINGTTANTLVVSGTQVGVNTASFISGATFQVNALDSIMLPVGTQGDRPGSPQQGMFRYSTTQGSIEWYNGTSWATASTAFTVATSNTQQGNGSATVFSLPVANASTAGTIISLNGIVQQPITAYSVSGSTVTFTEAPASTDVIDFRILSTTTTVTSVVDALGTTGLFLETPTVGNKVITFKTNGSESMSIQANAEMQMTGNITPTANVTYSLGTTTRRWKDLWLSGSTIYLGNIQIKESSGNVAFYGSDGTTPAPAAFNSIAHTGTTGTGNIGSSDSTFNTIFAKATSALYADLAENYLGTALYPAGTVVEFGGEAEIQVCDTDMSTRIAGVVSTNPAFIMNDRWPGAGPVNPIALQGRVPCKVKGRVRKGDMMVSAGNGYARAESKPVLGSVIGKALENFDGTEGVIEVVVGRL